MTLSGGIGIDHTAERRAVTGRQFRGKEIAVGLKKLVELVFDYPGFDPHPPLFGVDFDNTVHIARHIDDNPRVQRLTIGAGTTAAWGKNQRFKAWLRRQPRQ